MSAPKGVRCAGCYYFQPGDAHNDDAGACRRAPAIGHRLWPVVLPDDWCGEFRHQADLPGALTGKRP